MLIIEKRKGARAAYWAFASLCGLVGVGPMIPPLLPADLLVHGVAARVLVPVLLADVNTYVIVALAAALLGILWPGRLGYPNSDNVGRAALLAVVMGVMFVALPHYFDVNTTFWRGLAFGFFAAAVIPPFAEKF
jgi:hypothetical protein